MGKKLQNGWQLALHVRELLAIGVLLEVLPVEVVVTIILEVDGIQNAYWYINLFQKLNSYLFSFIGFSLNFWQISTLRSSITWFKRVKFKR